MCYSIDSEASLENLDSEWLSVINEDPVGKKSPLALIATKHDRREQDSECISENRGMTYRNKINRAANNNRC